MKLFWHPVHGELAKLPGDEYSYENKDTIANEIPPLYIDQPMETVYQRDRRLWVEQAMLREIVKIDRQSNEDEMKLLTQYYYEAYDIIQNEITNFNQ